MTVELVVRDTGVMPRRPPKTEAGPDEWAAWRVAYERERHGWSLGELARKVTEAGVPMQHQAIWQIENREPPRRISFGEAVAFCKVFGIEDVSDLGKPPDEIRNDELTELRQEVAELREAQQQLLDKFRHALAREQVLLQATGHSSPGEIKERLLRQASEGQRGDVLSSALTAAAALAFFGAEVHEILEEVDPEFRTNGPGNA